MSAATTLLRARLKDIRSLSNRYPYCSYANNHRIVFIHVPKTGGTSILDALGARNRDRMHLNWRIYRYANKYRFREYFKFAVVRHPYARLRSAYNHICRGGSNIKDRVLCEDILRRAPTFESFILEYLSHSSIMMHSLFMPQAWYVCDELGNIMVDRILRFENLNREFNALATERCWKTVDLPMKNCDQRRVNSSQLSDECASRIHELYRIDFDTFGYARADETTTEDNVDKRQAIHLLENDSFTLPFPSIAMSNT